MEHAPIPPVVKWHVAFAVCVTLAEGLLLFLPGLQTIREAVVPLTGWAAVTPYLFSVVMFPIFVLARKHPHHNMLLRGYIEGATWQLAIYAAISLIHFAIRFGREDYGNPYLMVSVWRPIWILAIPAAWWIALRNELKRKQFYNSKLAEPTDSGTERATRSEPCLK